jgi:hypothetical protein
MYAVTMCWPWVKFITGITELSTLQRLACLGTNRATRTSSTAAIEVLLRLPQLYLELEAEVREGIYRLCCSDNGSWKLMGTSMPTCLRAWRKKPSYRRGQIKWYCGMYVHNMSKHDNAAGRPATYYALTLLILSTSCSQSVLEEIRWKLYLHAQFKILSFSL